MRGAHVLITGATGFLGKVVLETLLRRQHALGIERVTLLIRGKRQEGARARFERQVAPSPCFAALPVGWTRLVDTVEGDLSRPRCALDEVSWRRLCTQTTHIVHCAASVDFDRPVQEAASANIVSSLNVLTLAQHMPQLQRLVSTSTAYVTPHREGPIEEALAELPRPASDILADIEAGVDERVLLAETGHANTYTYTKCIAEHLLVQRRGQVPLTLVRPSIISASVKYPQPGWIDSRAAFAGFVCTIGSGLLRVIDAQPDVRLDIVPVDHVATVLVDEALGQPGSVSAQVPDGGSDGSGDEARDADGGRVPIVHAVAGTAHTAHIGDTSAAIVRYFRRHRVHRRPHLAHLGPRSPAFAVQEALHHRLPAAAAAALTRARGDTKGARRLGRVVQTLATINRVFPYFTHHTFSFLTRQPLPAGFDAQAYVRLVCRGAHVHLMRRDAHALPLAGRGHGSARTDLAWALSRPQGTLAVRLAAAVARRALRRLFDVVSLDQVSLDRALLGVPAGARIVLAPTHRSHLDHVLCGYAFFARPQAGVGQPRPVVAEDALGRRGVGALLRRLRAVPLARAERAQGLEPVALPDDHAAVQLFLEGQRSRGRASLPPRRDVLAALQRTGETHALLPLGISYERIAEEVPFLRQLRGDGSGALSAPALWRWARRMARGRVRLGRAHLRAEAPILLGPHDDLDAVARALSRAWRRSIVCTDYHLRAFVQRHPKAHIDLPTLRDAIVARGGEVLPSRLPLPPASQLDGLVEAGLRQHWQHLFAAEIMARYPRSLAIQHACSEAAAALADGPRARRAERAEDAGQGPLDALLHALAEPQAQGYAALAHAVQAALAAAGDAARGVDVGSVARAAGVQDPSVAESALRALAQAKLLRLDDAGLAHSMGAPPSAWRAFIRGCALEPTRAAPRSAARAL